MKIRLISFKNFSDMEKLLLIRAFCLDKNEGGYVTKNGEQVLDKYTGEAIKFDNMDIFPTDKSGIVIIDDNPLSIISYMEEYGVEV